MKTSHSDALTPQEIAAVLRAAGEGRHGVRDHAMLLTLYHHGLRVSELCRLTLPDLDLEGRRLWVERLNRGRSGAHPVPEDEAQALSAYLAEREGQGTLNLPALFLNERRATLSRNAVYYLVRRAGEAAGLVRPLFPHLLRRSTGSKLVGEGHDVRLVQDYLGLRSARSVLRFVGEAPPEDPNAERFTALWGEAGGG
jgi:site-specific recombinase XerD